MADNCVAIAKGKKESIVCKLSSTAKETVQRNRHILAKIIQVVLLLGKQNIPFRGHTEERSNCIAVLQSHAQTDPMLANHLQNGNDNAQYTSPEKQNELIILGADQVRQQIISECRNSYFFAVMADEATDFSTKEQLSICVCFVGHNGEQFQLSEKFIGFVTCSSIKGVQRKLRPFAKLWT